MRIKWFNDREGYNENILLLWCFALCLKKMDALTLINVSSTIVHCFGYRTDNLSDEAACISKCHL